MSKTRNQIKRERTKTALLTVVSLVMLVVVSMMMFKTWANEDFTTEAEQQAYVAALKGGDN